jgi:DNA-binding MarR family transcriptional regulator
MNQEVSPHRAGRDAVEIAGALEGLFRLVRWLSPAGLSLTAAATLATLDRTGPSRLTELAAGEGVTQPAMTQLIARLAEQGLVARSADPDDGRVVRVHLSTAGREFLAARRAFRAERVSGLLATLSPAERDALIAALPAMYTLAAARPEDEGDLVPGR